MNLIYVTYTHSPVLAPRIIPLAYSIPDIVSVAPRKYQPYSHLRASALNIPFAWNTSSVYLTCSFISFDLHSNISLCSGLLLSLCRKQPPPQPLP